VKSFFVDFHFKFWYSILTGCLPRGEVGTKGVINEKDRSLFGTDFKFFRAFCLRFSAARG
jgi:hypothetical protein